jgi:hypothetical protein
MLPWGLDNPAERERWRANAGLFWFGLTKIPMLLFVGARWLSIDEQRAVIKIPLNFLTRNHLRSMYFAVFAVGADLVIGGLAWYLINNRKSRLQLIFKDFKAEYLKRAEADVHFVCERVDLLREMIAEAERSGERVNRTIPAYALVPEKLGSEPVALFELTLSLRRKDG